MLLSHIYLFLADLSIFGREYLLCAWDSNLGPKDGRRRRNHGAMAAARVK